VAAWHQYIDDSTIADAILDRIIHQAHRVELEGESLRKLVKIKSNIFEHHSHHLKKTLLKWPTFTGICN
jgi:hypothetical protein